MKEIYFFNIHFIHLFCASLLRSIGCVTFRDDMNLPVMSDIILYTHVDMQNMHAKSGPMIS